MLYDSYYKKISRVLDFCRKVFKHIVLISIIIALIIISVIALLATKGIVFDDKNAEDNFEISYGEGLPLNASAMLSKVRYEYSSDDGATWSEDMPIVPGEYSVRAVANTSFGGERYGKVYSFVLKAKSIEVFVGDSSVIYGELPEVKSNELSYGDKITCDKVVYEDIAAVDARVMPDKDSVKIFSVDGTDVTTSYDIEAVTTDIKINPRKIGFTVSGEEMVYNNVRLTYSGYEISSGTLAEGDTEQAVIDTKPLSEVGITEVGEFRCTPDFCIVTSDGVDVTEHYEISTKVGTLKVVERSIVVKTGSAEKVYDETELFCEDYEIMGGQGLVEGHSLSCESHLSIINADEKPNELKFRILDASGTVKTQNYSVFYEKGTLKITPRPITVNTADREWMYDNTEHYDDAQISGFCPNHSVKLELPSIIDAGEKDNAIKVLNVQNAEGEDVSSNYEIIYGKMGKLKVTKRPITITYGNISGKYNGEYYFNENYSITAGSLATDDRIEFTFPKFLQAVQAGEYENKPENAYLITKRNGEELRIELINNYELTEISGTVNISKRSITVTPNDAIKTYDGEPLNPESYSVSEELIPTVVEHTVTVEYTDSSAITNVGETVSKIKSVKIVRKDNAREIDVTESFEITTEEGNLKVTQRPITVTSGSATKVYDGTPLTCHEYTVGDNELVNGHNIYVSFTGTITDPGPAADNTFTVRIEDASQKNVIENYDVSLEFGSLTVTNEIKVWLSCSDGEAWELNGLNGRTKEYDGKAFDIRTDKVEAADGSELTGYTVELPTIVNVTYPDPKTITEDDITIKYDGSKLDKNKLNITVDGIKCYQITRREITLKANDVVKVYDGTELSASGYTVTSGELVVGHNLTASCEASETNVGVYDINVTNIQITDGSNQDVINNYRVSAEKGKLTITPRPIEVKTEGASQVYNGSSLKNSTYTIKSGSLAEGHSIVTTGFQTDVGTSPNTFKIVVDQTGAEVQRDNYNISESLGTLTVTPRSLCITLSCDEGEQIDSLDDSGRKKIYDGKPFIINSDPPDSFLLDNGYTVKLPKIVNVSDSKELSANDIIIKNGSGEEANDNFNIILEGVTKYQINPREIEVETKGDSQVYNGNSLTNANFEIKRGSLAEGHSIVTTGSQTNVGTSQNTFKIVDQTGAEVQRDNYTISESLGTLTITPFQVNIELICDDGTKTYDGNPFDIDYDADKSFPNGHTVELPKIVNVLDSKELSADDITIKNGSGEEVNSNFNIILEGVTKYQINPREIEVETKGDSQVYNGNSLTNANFEIKRGSLAEGHSIVTTGSQTKAGTSQNTFKIVDKTGAEVQSGNYTIYESLGTLTVTKRPITVTSGSYERVYDGTPLECHEAYASKHGTYSLLTNVGELVIECEYTGKQPEVGYSSNYFTVSSVTDNNGSGNYDVHLECGTLTVTKRTIVIATGSAQKVYDGTPLTRKECVVVVSEESLYDLVGGHKINNTEISDLITGTITAPGKTSNTFDSELYQEIKILDGNDEEVTENYEIIRIDEGELEVLKPETAPVAIKIYLFPSTKYYDGKVLDFYDYAKGGYYIFNPEVYGECTFNLIQKDITDSTLLSTGAYSEQELFTVRRLNEGELWREYFEFTVNNGSANLTSNYYLEIVDLKGNADSDMVVWGIFKKGIELTSASVTDHYKEGQILSNSTVELTKGSLLEGHTLTAKATGELSSVGEIDNTIDRSSVKILDSLGKDVTSNYDITYVEGTLKYLEQG